MLKKKPGSIRKKPHGKRNDIIPYHRKPSDLSLEEWQIALRKQFVQNKSFQIRKVEGHPVFTDYFVYNPETKNTYKVALRNNDQVMNFCSCMDFKTNHLGTCKHIEAVLIGIRKKSKLSAILKKGYLPPYSSVYLQYGKERKIRIRIGTDFGQDFRLLAGEYFDQGFSLTPYGYTHFEHFLDRARTIDRDFRCYDDALEFVIEVRDKQKRMDLMNDRYPTGAELQGILSEPLFPYQQNGILFALKAGRCMITDEMGLGKTIQAIGIAEVLKRDTGISNVLIVCPTSLKYQWQSEIVRFSAGTVQVLEGMPHIRQSQYRSSAFYKIVSYHTLSNDLDVVNQMEFDLVILDEAQRIKNWKTRLAQSVKKIRSQYAIVLTGTPLENKLEDLYSIVQFVDPYKLGPYYHFLDRYQVKNETGKITGYRHLHEINRLLSDIMIRRTKNEVMMQLPERMDKIFFVSMTRRQMDMHDEFKDVVAKLVNRWKKLGFLNEKDRQRLMINLNLMRMACDSTYIIDQETRHDTKIEELMNILDESLSNNREKVVIFSQWERMTRLVAIELNNRTVRYEYLHGGIPSAKRKSLFDNFNTEPDCRIFLSTDAGSTGLNLQSGSLIINLDIPWNPAVLEQRIARVHRFGQKNKVSVINFVSTGTIEHRMLAVLDVKTSLFKGVLDNGEDSIFLDEDRFRQFMKTVQEIATVPEEQGVEEILVPVDAEVEKTELQELPACEPVEKEVKTEIPGDDDITVTGSATQPSEETGITEMPEPAILISQGLNFLSGLARTFSSPEATGKLVASFIEKDETSGKSYLRIPVENEKTLSDALNLIGQIFKSFSKT